MDAFACLPAEGDPGSGEQGRQFFASCSAALQLVRNCAQDDLLEAGVTLGMFAVAQERRGAVCVEAVSGRNPDVMEPDASNAYFLDLAQTLAIEGRGDAVAVRVLTDMWVPDEGLTPEGRSYLAKLPAPQQAQVPGAYPIWVAEFMSAGGVWYARVTHPIERCILQRAELQCCHLAGLGRMNSSP